MAGTATQIPQIFSGGGGSSGGLTSPVGAADGGTGRTSLTSGSFLVGAGTGQVTFAVAPAGTVVGTSDTQTITNKRITPRIGTTASSATPTPDADAHDQYNITALAAAAQLQAPSGTPTDGQTLVWRIKDNGTARALTYVAAFRAIGTVLPTTTVLSKTLYLGTRWNAADSKWDVIAVAQEA